MAAVSEAMDKLSVAPKTKELKGVREAETQYHPRTYADCYRPRKEMP